MADGPDTTLHELRMLTRQINDAERRGDLTESAARAWDITTAFETLDQWLTTGGNLPKDWAQRQPHPLTPTP